MKAELKRKVVDQLIEIVEEGGSFQAGFSSLAGLPTNAGVLVAGHGVGWQSRKG